MLKNYFVVALRNFWRNKAFSAINILGLAIGISASLVIYLLVSYDFSFDKFEKDNNRVYRVVTNFVFNGDKRYAGGVCAPMSDAVKKEITGVGVVAPFWLWDNVKVKLAYPSAANPRILKKEKESIFADENYFKIVPYTWLIGSPQASLSKPYQLVLTESRAKRYFPGLAYDKIIGQQVIVDDTVTTTVSGIVKDLSQHSDFTFQSFASFVTLRLPRFDFMDFSEWGSTMGSSQLFLKLSPGSSPARLEKEIDKMQNRYYKDPDSHTITAYALQPLSDLHFNEKYGNFHFSENRLAHKPTLYSLLAVAAFLLLLACINFINLTTAQASQRAKEIGVRKTMGSSKLQLALQFLTETFLLTLIATLLSIAFTPLLLQVFADFIPAGLHFNLLQEPGVILFLAGLLFVVSLLSGVYPALLLSSYKPVTVLKKQTGIGTGKAHTAWLRKSLSVTQFVIAQVFIIATILVGKQINYTLNKDLGFKKDAIIFFNVDYNDTVEAHKKLLVQQISNMPEVAMVSVSSNPPSINSTWNSGMKFTNGKDEISTEVQIKNIDENYIKLYQIKLLAGTNLTNSDTTNGMLINETYLHKLGFKKPQDAVGKLITWRKKVPVKGVVADFYAKSLHEVIMPLVLVNGNHNAYKLNVEFKPQNADGSLWKDGIAKVGDAVKATYPGFDFDYYFLDETIAKYYTAEQNISKLLAWATGLAIFISCLGLLGLVIYITTLRTKEIGIRKVVGATVAQIVFLLSKDFLKLIIIAFIVTIPIAWLGANKWLENFAYKTTLTWWLFALGGAVMLILAFLVMLVRTLKAATDNPVLSLKTE